MMKPLSSLDTRSFTQKYPILNGNGNGGSEYHVGEKISLLCPFTYAFVLANPTNDAMKPEKPIATSESELVNV
jgi:hypothetical protein